MKPDRKLLLRVAGVLAALVVAYFFVDYFLLAPAGAYRERADRLRRENRQCEYFLTKEGTYRRRLKDIAGRTFGTDPLAVREAIRVRIDKMVSASGMRRGTTASSPVVGRHKKDSYQEIGWKYDLIGKLPQAIDMLYLLREDPYLHRIEGLTLTPTGESNEVKLDFRYMTLVLEPRKGETLPTGDPETPKPIAELGEPRNRYDPIARRNIFRPYIRKRAEQPLASQPADPSGEPPVADSGQGGRFRVVSLSRFGTRQDISVRDSQTGEVQMYNPGDALGGGTIVMVDQRSMPDPGKPELLSPSRLIIRIGQQYFAVELGQTLDEKNRLAPDQLPASFRPAGARNNIPSPDGAAG
jgi:hypothetical protein